MNVLKAFGLVICLIAGATVTQAQPDYAPALWNPAYANHWYTSGNGHSFCVIHDMEGYYESTISYFQRSGTSASIHYCVNGLQNGNDGTHVENNPGDAPAGEITQMVRETYYAWHVLCWNTWTFGTEHEGFVSNPAWYTEAMYQASAGLQKHLCDTFGIPKDRNHIIGHNEWQTPSWTNWMAANWPQIDATCNTHTDPGQYWNWSHFMQLVNGGPSPAAITTQPLNRSVDQGASVSFRVSAIGDVPLSYQWRKNGVNLIGPTGSSYSLANVQAGNAAGYSVVVTNASGSATSSVATLTVNLPQVLQVAYADNLDTNSSANWNLFTGSANNVSDYTATWAFDYSTNGYTFKGTNQIIPVAPSTTNGVRRGLKLTVNKNDNVATNSGVSLYPKSQSFTSNYVLRFDMWINYNGNAGGGSGSTEFATFGINHTGTRVNWGSANATSSDGLWFTVDGDGGAATDYRAYVGNSSGNPTQLSLAASGLTANGAQSDDSGDSFYQGLFPSPAYESSGLPGKHWVQGEISQFNNVITWRLNGVVVAQRTNTTSYTSGNIMLGYMDIFSSIANPPQDNYVIFDNVRVLTQVYPPIITTQPVGRMANQGANTTFSVTTGGTAPLAYLWRFNNSPIAAATSSSYTRTNLQPSDVGSYSVVITNAAGSVTSSSAGLVITQLKIASLASTNGGWRLTLTGAPGSGYEIQTSTNLTDWTLLATLVNTNGTLQYSDSVATNSPQRFYRVSAPK
ncbi:MAG: Immunoglobulin I-set domain protein [Pedosphaera sp.]|nr:Immunoglobulin I-set domain protein [Pedosphaera sp.]